MRIERAVRLAATCALLGALGCEDIDRDPPYNPGGGGGGGGGRDAGASDSGTQADTGTTADTGTAADTGTGTDAAADAQADAAGLLASSSGPWTVYMNPYGDAGGANPATGIMGSASARAVDGGMEITLSVSGLPPERGFGSHLHKLACDNMSAGGHYQHMPAAAVDASVTNPAFANPTNEAWLDFTTNGAGAAMSTASVSWIPSEGGASSIVVHDRLTGDGGVAGAKLACLPFPL